MSFPYLWKKPAFHNNAMSQTFTGLLTGLATRQASSPSNVINLDLDRAHLRLTGSSRDRPRPGDLREISEDSTYQLATSLGLEWAVDKSDSRYWTVSIAGKIMVVDISVTAETYVVDHCNLTIALTMDNFETETEDGMVLEKHIKSGRLDLFSKNLRILAFMDKHSEAEGVFSLYEVHRNLRKALESKLKTPDGFPVEIRNMYCELTFVYYKNYTASIEIEEQPISACFDRSMIDSFKVRDMLQKPVLRYPQSWLDENQAWLPDIELLKEPFRPGFRFVLIFNQPVVIPISVLQQLADGFEPRWETRNFVLSPQRSRRVYDPDGDHMYTTTVETELDSKVLTRIAFTHPKEIKRILSIAQQFIRCQEFLETLGKSETVGQRSGGEELTIKVELSPDAVSDIDNRTSIKIAIFSSATSEENIATITILPDSSEKCWHKTNSTYFSEAIKKTNDVLISLIATSQQAVLR